MSYGIVEEMKTITVQRDARKVVAEPGVANLGREREELRNASKGAVGGAVIGLFFGIAVLNTMGLDRIPGIFEAVLLVACAVFGGAMFGAIVGSTGLFAGKKRNELPS